MLGQLACKIDGRDSTHINYIALEATVALQPGEHVKVGDKYVGIVDPFLTEPVKPGQWYYLCLYPGSVTIVKHHWSHPAFPEESEDSVAWIAEYATQHGYTYDKFMDMAREYAEYGNWTYDNREKYKDVPDRWREFWTHYEKVTGQSCPEKDWGFFTCSC